METWWNDTPKWNKADLFKTHTHTQKTQQPRSNKRRKSTLLANELTSLC